MNIQSIQTPKRTNLTKKNFLAKGLSRHVVTKTSDNKRLSAVSHKATGLTTRKKTLSDTVWLKLKLCTRKEPSDNPLPKIRFKSRSLRIRLEAHQLLSTW